MRPPQSLAVQLRPLANTAFRRHVGRLAWPERWQLGAGMAFLGSSSAIGLAFPRASGAVLDMCLAADPQWTPGTAAAALAGLFTAQSILIAGRVHIFNAVGERVAASLRKETFDVLVHKPLAFFDTTRTGELISRLSADTASLQKVVTTHFTASVRGVLMVGGCLGMMTTISPSLCLVSAAAFPPAALLSRAAGARLKQHQKGVQEALAASSAEASSSLLALRMLRLHNAETAAADRYATAVGDACTQAVRVGTLSAVVEASVSWAIHGSLLTVMAVGGSQVISGALSYGDLSAFLM